MGKVKEGYFQLPGVVSAFSAQISGIPGRVLSDCFVE
jgi:hypothetical protein